ncbi:50S ribosomal protein L2 [Patescibacteria group bacterium]
MTIKTFKPTSPAKRKMAVACLPTTKNYPEKKLTQVRKKNSGRNNTGRITVRHHGGRQKQKYRMVDFKQDKYEMEGKVIAIEYDPARSALIGLIQYSDSERRYILLPEELQVGDTIICSKKRIDIKPGNRAPLKSIPAGTNIHNIEMEPGHGGQIVKSAGSQAIIMSKEGDFANLKLPSGEIRRIRKESFASVGQVSNSEHSNEVIGKAGRKRLMGTRPTNRGKAQNPNDHPHGGGEGQQSIGLKGPKTPWGKYALGLKTRNKKKRSSIHITRRRK